LKVKEEFYFCVQNVTKLKCDEKVHFHQKNLLPKILDIKSTVFNPANNAMIRYLTEYNNNSKKMLTLILFLLTAFCNIEIVYQEL
jgi:hypothetical protein